MSSILEKALTYLLNDEQDKAEQLFHQFIIATEVNAGRPVKQAAAIAYSKAGKSRKKKGK